VKRVFVALAMAILYPAFAVAQTPSDRGVEIGVFAGALDLRESVGEKPFAVGVRAGYRLSRWLALEGEFLRCRTATIPHPTAANSMSRPTWFTSAQ
jgi:hypothetical protein